MGYFGVDAGAGEDGDHIVVVGGGDVAREHDEALVLQLFELHGLAVCVGVVFGHADDELVRGHGQGGELRGDGRGVDETGVDLAAQQFVDLVGAGHLSEHHVHVGHLRVELPDDVRHLAVDLRAGHAYLQPAAHASGDDLGHIRCTRHLLQDLSGFFEEGLAGLGQLHVLAVADQQLHLQLRLQ
ncbi:hypothetical protein D3C71_1538470 [compost metagenome]